MVLKLWQYNTDARSESVPNHRLVMHPIKNNSCIHYFHLVVLPIFICLSLCETKSSSARQQTKTQTKQVSRLAFTLLHLEEIQLHRAIKESDHFQCLSFLLFKAVKPLLTREEMNCSCLQIVLQNPSELVW